MIWPALSGDPQRMGEALLAAVHTRKTHTKDFLDLLGPVVPTTNGPRLPATFTKLILINHLRLSSPKVNSPLSRLKMQIACQDVLPIYVQGIGNLRGRDGRGLCQLNICGLPIYWQRIDNIPCGMRDTPYKGEKVSEARRPLTDAGSGYCGIPDTICGAPHTVPCYVFSGVANILLARYWQHCYRAVANRVLARYWQPRRRFKKDAGSRCQYTIGKILAGILQTCCTQYMGVWNTPCIDMGIEFLLCFRVSCDILTVGGILCFNGAMNKLTAKQEKFCQNIVSGENQ